MAFHLSSFLIVLSTQRISLFKNRFYSRSVLVDFHLVPSLLQEVSPVAVSSVAVTEGNAFDVVRYQWLLTGKEIILRKLGQQGMLSRNDISKHGFAGTVPAYNCDVLVVVEFKVHWLSHLPLRHASHSMINLDDTLSIHQLQTAYSFLVLFGKVLPAFYRGR